jgi:hypothetical protein
MSTLQNNRKSLQENPVALAGTIILLIVSGLAMWKPVILLFLAVAIGGGVVAWHLAEKRRLLRESAARAAAYANICGPVVIASQHPAETVNEVRARADEFREQMRLSGNPYWLQIPVVAYPFEPMLFGVGQLTAAWNLYQRLAGEKQHAENLVWADRCPAQLKAIFLSQVMPSPQTDADGFETVRK